MASKSKEAKKTEASKKPETEKKTAAAGETKSKSEAKQAVASASKGEKVKKTVKKTGIISLCLF